MRTNLQRTLHIVSPHEGGQGPDDGQDLSQAVLSPGLALTRDSASRLVVHTLSGGRAEELGAFPDAASALSALDQLELADELDVAV
jgi:hypothetical protein